MLQNLGGAHLLVIVFIVLLLFGAPKLPGLAKSLGQSMRILRKEVRSDVDIVENDAANGRQNSLAAVPVEAAPRVETVPRVSSPPATGAQPGQPDVR